jgi:FkbM family methyltransferase
LDAYLNSVTRWLRFGRAGTADTPGVSVEQERLTSALQAAAPESSRAIDRALAHASLCTHRIVFIDVGCRWGAADTWVRLGELVRVVGFDPDQAECERLQQSVDPNIVRYVPLALGAANGTRKLFVTRDPACSSLYPPDNDVIAAHPELDVMTQVATTDVHVTRFDDWAGMERLQPDVFKVDVQGAELDVLQGAERSLATVRALELEVEFNPLYTGQPLFADVDRYLRGRGFVLWHLDHLVHYGALGARESAWPASQYFNGRSVQFTRFGGQLSWGHAYYVRSDVVQAGGDRGQLSLDAVVAATLGLDDLADSLLAKVDAAAPAGSSD